MQKNTKDLAKKKAIVKDTVEKKKKTVENNVNKTVKNATNSTKKVSSSNAKKKNTTKKTTAKKSSVSVKNTAKKATTTESAESNTSKVTAPKIKQTTKTSKNIKPKKTSPSKKASTPKKSTATKKRTITKKTTSGKVKKAEIIEYYDLPYRYNQTVVKILAQTPNTLFVYWDIADADRKKYEDKYGKTFFESTYPVLIVHNKTMNYSFEIEINDFANSWYFNINDAKCDYEIELGRRSRHYTVNLPNNYIHVASSNKIETPNDHILFEKNQKTLFFRNVKNNIRISKDVSQFQFIKYIGKIYNIYDIYKEIYKHEELQDLEKNNPSSSF